MNGRFKFRVWYKLYNGYVEERDHLVLLPNGILCEYDGVEIDSDNYIIEMCTGLKDKNGKLIYENDQFYDSNKRLCTVSWHNGAFHNGFGNLLGNFRTDEIEIIGNIHEQAEQKDK